MFNRFLSLFLLSAALMTLAPSCEKIASLLSNNISATVDGASFYSSAATGTIVAGKLTLTGTNGNGSDIMNILVPASITPGIYSLGSVVDYGIQLKKGGLNISNSTSGTLTITSHDPAAKLIKGTFNCSAVDSSLDTVVITNGSFSVSYF